MADTFEKDPLNENNLVITHDAPKSSFSLEELEALRDAAQIRTNEAQGAVDKWQALIDEALALGVKPKS